jgi:S-layer homology domain
MKRSISLLAATILSLAQATPAFAYQAHNWPGVAAKDAAVSATDAPAANDQMQDDDGSALTRAEFTAQLIDTLYTEQDMEGCFGRITYKDHPGYSLLFWDVHRNDDHALQICMGMHLGLINGYRDGNFRPNQPITFAEASKMIAKIYAFTPYPFTREPVWYRPYIAALATREAVPTHISAPSDGLTREDLAWMLRHLGSNKTNSQAGAGSVIFTKRAEKPVSSR